MGGWIKWDQLMRCVSFRGKILMSYTVLRYTLILLDTLGIGISSLARLGRHPMTVMGIQSFGLDSFRKCIEFEVCWSLQVIWCDLLSDVQLTSFLRSIHYFLLYILSGYLFHFIFDPLGAIGEPMDDRHQSWQHPLLRMEFSKGWHKVWLLIPKRVHVWRQMEWTGLLWMSC